MRTTCALLLTSLTLLAGCTGTAGSDSRDLTAQQCRDYYVHTYRLAGMDAAAMMGDQLDKDSQTCADTGMVTKRHFDCAMAATSVEALGACGVPNT
jgi:hypothetical protein